MVHVFAHFNRQNRKVLVANRALDEPRMMIIPIVSDQKREEFSAYDYSLVLRNRI